MMVVGSDKVRKLQAIDLSQDEGAAGGGGGGGVDIGPFKRTWLLEGGWCRVSGLQECGVLGFGFGLWHVHALGLAFVGVGLSLKEVSDVASTAYQKHHFGTKSFVCLAFVRREVVFGIRWHLLLVYIIY